MAVGSYGTVLKFTPSGGSQVVVGKLSSIGEIAPEAEELDVTTLDAADGWRAYIQGYKDAGTLAVEGFHDKNDAGQAALIAAYRTGAAGAFTVEFPDGATAGFSAFVKSYTLGAAEVDGAVGFAAEMRITGAVTYASN